MAGPKTFISYSESDRALAQRLKGDLDRNGCDPWQFDLSAVPGTDAWGAILERIEKNDFFVAILSRGATASRAVQEEIAHAHYCGVNSAEGRPRMIPLVVDQDVAVPRQMVRAVRLPFRQEHYNNDFEHLLNALGIEKSPFSFTTDLDVTFSRGKEFDVEREAGIYASKLIHDEPEVRRVFDQLSANARAMAGGRWRMPLPKMVTWEANTWGEASQPQLVRKSEFKILVIFPLRCGFHTGYESTERVAMEIEAFDELKYDYVGSGDALDVILHSDTLRLKFAGFREVISSPLNAESASNN
jgi:TIR domain